MLGKTRTCGSFLCITFKNDLQCITQFLTEVTTKFSHENAIHNMPRAKELVLIFLWNLGHWYKSVCQITWTKIMYMYMYKNPMTYTKNSGCLKGLALYMAYWGFGLSPPRWLLWGTNGAFWLPQPAGIASSCT